jgi:hypothetical protein
MKLRLAVMGIVLCAAAQAAFAAPVPGLYAQDGAGDLYRINTTNASATLIGGLVSPYHNGPTEIVYDNIGGTAFAEASGLGFAGNFFDITTGMQTSGLIPNGGSFTGLQYVGSTLYGTEIFGSMGPSTLSILNPFTGATTPIGLTGVGPISGLAYNHVTSTMYGIGGGPGPSVFYTISLGTGLATPVFTTDFQAGGLSYGLDGNIYAGTSGANGGLLYRIDLNNHSDTLVGATGLNVIPGMTLVVPEPSTVVLLGLGVVSLVAYRLRKRFV